MFPTSGRFLVEWRSSWRCFRTKDWNSTLQASTSDPFSQRHLMSPTINCPYRKKAEWSSPPSISSGQKQLTPWPSLDLTVTVDKIVLQNSSRKRWALAQNSFLKYETDIFSRAALMRVPTRKCPLQKRRLMNASAAYSFPLLHWRQQNNLPSFVQNAKHEVWQLTVCPITVTIAKWLLCDEIVIVWNNRDTSEYQNSERRCH